MMNHFKFQSLVFYGVAISSVLLLFKVVTAYGESNLKASAPIDGSYRLALKDNLPNCPKPADLVLNIQQSGIYLNGSLLPVENNAPASSTQEKLSLTGILKNQQLSLFGTVPTSVFCNTPAQPNNSTQVNIQSQVQKENLVGKLSLNSSPAAIAFTAQREAPVQPANSSSH